MQETQRKTSVQGAALIAGFAILTSAVAAPFAELYAYPKLVVPDEAAETARHILSNGRLFIFMIFGYLITFFCDIVIAWALYILLKPVNEDVSLFTAWLRLVYAVIAVVALNNLVTVWRLLNTPDYLKMFQPDQLYVQAMIYVRAFRNHWYFGMIFFAIHLLLLGYLVIRSHFIPRILGVLLMITGIGYLLTTVRPYLLPNVNVDFAQYTFYGELIFMFWLLLRGSKIRETNFRDSAQSISPA